MIERIEKNVTWKKKQKPESIAFFQRVFLLMHSTYFLLAQLIIIRKTVEKNSAERPNCSKWESFIVFYFVLNACQQMQALHIKTNERSENKENDYKCFVLFAQFITNCVPPLGDRPIVI